MEEVNGQGLKVKVEMEVICQGAIELFLGSPRNSFVNAK